MDNKVGDNVPSNKKLGDLLDQLRSVVQELQKFCITLHAEDRLMALKPHDGAEKLARETHDLAKRYDINVKNVPLEGMMNDLRLSEAIQPFAKELALGAQLSADTRLQANAEYYTAFLAYYGALNNAANHDPALAAELKPIQEAMRKVRRPRNAPAAGGTPGGAPTG